MDIKPIVIEKHDLLGTLKQFSVGQSYEFDSQKFCVISLASLRTRIWKWKRETGDINPNWKFTIIELNNPKRFLVVRRK